MSGLARSVGRPSGWRAFEYLAQPAKTRSGGDDHTPLRTAGESDAHVQWLEAVGELDLERIRAQKLDPPQTFSGSGRQERVEGE